MENDLCPVDMSQEVPDFTIEETIGKMENLCQQVLEVAAGNIKKAQAHQAKTHNAKHARNDFEVDAKSVEEKSIVEHKTKITEKESNVERPIQSGRQNTGWELLAQRCQRQGQRKG